MSDNTVEKKESSKGLTAQSQRVHQRMHFTGLIIGIIMLVTTVALGIGVFYKITQIYHDILYKTIDYLTMSDINAFVSWSILAVITFLAAMIFYAMYREQSPFSRDNVIRIKVIAVLLMVLSIAPIGIEMAAAYKVGLNIGFSMNLMYIFIGVILYCISFVFEHGQIMQEKTNDIINVQEQVILAFAEITEAKSDQTGQHVKRVSEYCRIIAEGMGLSNAQVENLRLASMMHDVGKLLIPGDILERESSLSDEEYELMKTHVQIGEQLLQNADGEIMEEARKVALEHHEQWDGTGYLGKKGEEISLSARIVALADEFDSLISARSYKTGWESNKIYSSIVEESGRKFDPEVVQIFVRNYSKLVEVYKKFSETTPGRTVSFPKAPTLKSKQPAAQTVPDTDAVTAIDTDLDLDLRHLI